jgi:hypothetical protein
MQTENANCGLLEGLFSVAIATSGADSDARNLQFAICNSQFAIPSAPKDNKELIWELYGTTCATARECC